MTEVSVPVSVRLDDETLRLLDALARRSGSTRSAVIREAIGSFSAAARARDRWEGVRHLIGSVDLQSEEPLSEQTGRRFAELLHARRTR